MAPQLTPSEIRHLQARAVAEMRSIGGYVAFLVVRHLSGRGNGRKRRRAVVSPTGQRVSYEIAVPLTLDQMAQVQAKARDQVRSVSSYVARLIVEELGKE